MADWVEQYLAALRARDEVEKPNIDLYEHCTRLQDQKAALAARVADTASPAPSLFRVTSPTPRPESPSLGQMRQDLAKSQQERSDLQSGLHIATKKFETLEASSKKDTKNITQLKLNVSQLTLKLRDRDEELKGKAKLLEDVQDENVTLNLQLNVAEENAKKLKKENQDLVDRWMARMGKEADRMNEQSKFR